MGDFFPILWPSHNILTLLLVERFAVGRTGVRQCDGTPEGN